MKRLSFLIAAGLLLGTLPTYAADDRPDVVDRIGRALQNDNDHNRDRDRSRDYRDDRSSGSSGYDRRDVGRGEDRRYDERRRYDDSDRRYDDRDRSDYRR